MILAAIYTVNDRFFFLLTTVRFIYFFSPTAPAIRDFFLGPGEKTGVQHIITPDNVFRRIPRVMGARSPPRQTCRATTMTFPLNPRRRKIGECIAFIIYFFFFHYYLAPALGPTTGE